MAELLACPQRLLRFLWAAGGLGASDTSESGSKWDDDVISPKSGSKTSPCPFYPAAAL